MRKRCWAQRTLRGEGLWRVMLHGDPAAPADRSARTPILRAARPPAMAFLACDCFHELGPRYHPAGDLPGVLPHPRPPHPPPPGPGGGRLRGRVATLLLPP